MPLKGQTSSFTDSRGKFSWDFIVTDILAFAAFCFQKFCLFNGPLYEELQQTIYFGHLFHMLFIFILQNTSIHT